MAITALKVGETIKIGHYVYRVRKISKKDVIIRLVRPQVPPQVRSKPQGFIDSDQVDPNSPKDQNGKQVDPNSNGKASQEEELFEKTF